MAHPKRKISVTRRNKRRTHHALAPIFLSTCPLTGVAHKPHQAFWQEGILYYRGKKIIDLTEA